MVALFLALFISTGAAQDRGARGDDVAFAQDDDAAYDAGPRDRLSYTNATFARVNPLGFINVFRIGYKRRLS